MNIPKTIIEFQDTFQTEDDCLAYLQELRWPKGFICPNCFHDDGYRLECRPLIQCSVCRHQTSVTAGTIFHKTRTPLRHWFWMIFHLSSDKGGASSSRLAKQLGMHQSTVWNLLQKLKHSMSRRDENISLSGFIELDEAIIGPHARKEGRPSSSVKSQKPPKRRSLGCRSKSKSKKKFQTEVLVLVERERFHAGNLVMNVVYKTTREAIREVVEERVEDNRQMFKTDALQSHYVLESMGHDLQTLKLSGSPESCEQLPIVHRAISLLKRSLMGTYHGVSPRYLNRYLAEFCFRWNRRDSESTIWFSMLKAACFALPMGYAELIR